MLAKSCTIFTILLNTYKIHLNGGNETFNVFSLLIPTFSKSTLNLDYP